MQATIKIIIIVFFLPLQLFSQDLSGLWQGTLYNDTTQQYLKYEIGISKNERGKLSGFSHTWFIVDDKQYYGVKKLRISSAKDGKIIVEDDGLLSNNYPISPAKKVRQLNVLTLNVEGDEMKLSGPFATNRTKEYHSLTGYISLQKKTDFRQSALVPHLQELGLDDELSFVKEENESMAGLARKEYEADALKQQKERQQQIVPAKSAQPTNNTVSISAENIPPAETAIAASGSTDIKNEIPGTELKTAANAGTSEIAGRVTKTNKKRKEKPAITVTNNEEVPIIKTEPAVAVNQETISTAIEPAQPSNTKEQVNTTAKIQQTPAKSKTISSPEMPVNRGLPAIANTSPVVNKDFKNPVADFTRRTTIIQQTVYFKTDSLQLALYDNGEVDGDTVSIFMNGQLLMERQGLSTKAIRKTIYLDPSVDSISIVMYAENLGTIAPNTGLMVVRDGKDLYEIRFSGDLQKNAAIIFRRKKVQ